MIGLVKQSSGIASGGKAKCCRGKVQASYDEYSKCIAMRGLVQCSDVIELYSPASSSNVTVLLGSAGLCEGKARLCFV